MRNSVIIAAMAAAAVTTVALPAATSSVNERAPNELTIQISQSDLRDQSSSVYLLLRRTAREACDSRSSELRMQREDRACAARTLDTAVADLNRPFVTARHQQAVTDTRYATGY